MFFTFYFFFMVLFTNIKLTQNIEASCCLRYCQLHVALGKHNLNIASVELCRFRWNCGLLKSKMHFCVHILWLYENCSFLSNFRHIACIMKQCLFLFSCGIRPILHKGSFNKSIGCIKNTRIVLACITPFLGAKAPLGRATLII